MAKSLNQTVEQSPLQKRYNSEDFSQDQVVHTSPGGINGTIQHVTSRNKASDGTKHIEDTI